MIKQKQIDEDCKDDGFNMKPKVLMNSFRMSESRLARLDYLGVNEIELVFN